MTMLVRYKKCQKFLLVQRRLSALIKPYRSPFIIRQLRHGHPWTIFRCKGAKEIVVIGNRVLNQIGGGWAMASSTANEVQKFIWKNIIT